jgi:putative glycosyltransferase (TIGR04348 family)
VNIQLVTPAPLKINNGNKITALRWAGILKKLGHRVRITQGYHGDACDALIALHARRSYDAIQRFHDSHPDQPLVVALTGTDVYRDIHVNQKAKRSLDLATRLVALQRMALLELPKRLRDKTTVIYQSAEPIKPSPRHQNGHFNVCVIGHLRSEKDPLRAALAVRNLPSNSRIRVTHIGETLDRKLGAKFKTETMRNPRFRWIGKRSHKETRAFLARSDLVCITSKMEGSSNVLSEALASGVPVAASRISGLIGTLGTKFPGFYPVGNTKELRKLILKAERDRRFYNSLKRYCRDLAYLVKPKREFDAWRRLLKGIF